jgi:5'-nucleotidase
MKYGALLAVALLIGGCSKDEASAPKEVTPAGATGDIQILSLSTFLGQLDPLSEKGADGQSHDYGGLGVLSAYFAADRAAYPNTLLFLTAVGLGASPPLSTLFQDEPTIAGLNFLGVDGDTLGNHNFNNGLDRLRALAALSHYPYVATNLVDATTQLGPNVVTPYKMLDTVGGAVKVAILGITSPAAPSKTVPGNFGTITIREPIGAANAAARDARAAGAHVVVALTQLESTDVDATGTHLGPLIDFAKGVTGVDVVLGYRATEPKTTTFGDVLVLENRWKGRTYGKVQVHVKDGVVTAKTGEIVEPDKALVTPDPAAEELLAPYRTKLADEFDKALATTTGEFVRDGSERTTEAPIGDLIMDAVLAKYRPAGAEVALLNSGGIRSAIPSSYQPRNKALRRQEAEYRPGPPFDVVVGDIYTVLPFGNTCVVRPITSATLWAMLETSVFDVPVAATKFLQIAGLKFTYKESQSPGARVQSVTLDDGTRIARDDTRMVTVVVSNVMSTGGDSYGILIEPSPTPGRDVMADVLLDYVRTKGALTPVTSGRITKLP